MAHRYLEIKPVPAKPSEDLFEIPIGERFNILPQAPTIRTLQEHMQVVLSDYIGQPMTAVTAQQVQDAINMAGCIEARQVPGRPGIIEIKSRAPAEHINIEFTLGPDGQIDR